MRGALGEADAMGELGEATLDLTFGVEGLFLGTLDPVPLDLRSAEEPPFELEVLLRLLTLVPAVRPDGDLMEETEEVEEVDNLFGRLPGEPDLEALDASPLLLRVSRGVVLPLEFMALIDRSAYHPALHTVLTCFKKASIK